MHDGNGQQGCVTLRTMEISSLLHSTMCTLHQQRPPLKPFGECEIEKLNAEGGQLKPIA
jgi:hypothetical protein